MGRGGQRAYTPALHHLVPGDASPVHLHFVTGNSGARPTMYG